MSAKPLMAADLFCGAGGTSTGLSRAAEILGRRVNLVAVNHWERAVETHAANHPGAAHFCQSLADLDPRKAVPGGKLDLLVASPECTHHSVARGGKPVNDQTRASAYCVHRWCAALDVKRVLIENVPEFATWGPLGSNGRPLASGKGKLFDQYVKTFQAMGYRVEWRVLNAADYGAATSRRRLFLQAVKGRAAIRWPDPTHEPNPTPNLFGSRRRWRAAREVIDWRLKGQSIFARRRPLSANTLKRIEAGLRKFGGANAEPFILLLNRHGNAPVGVSDPLTTVTATSADFALCEPFVMRACNGGDDNCRVKSPDQALGTIHAGGGSYGLVEPFILPPEGIHRGNAPRSADFPLQTVTAGRGGGCMVEPFILPHRQFDGMQVDSIDAPVRTITAQNGGCNAVVEPFVVPYYRTGVPDSVADPLSTITTRDRLGLVTTDGRRLDILFRMLQPHELAAAMGFPAGYRITGNRSEQVRQIGNAVVVEQAQAMCAAMLGEN